MTIGVRVLPQGTECLSLTTALTFRHLYFATLSGGRFAPVLGGITTHTVTRHAKQGFHEPIEEWENMRPIANLALIVPTRTPHTSRWPMVQEKQLQLELNDDKFRRVFESQGSNIMEPVHIVSRQPPTSVQPQPTLPFWILYPAPLQTGSGNLPVALGGVVVLV